MQSMHRPWLTPVLLLGLYLGLLALPVAGYDLLSRQEAADILQWYVPWNLKVNFFLILACLLGCYQNLIPCFRRAASPKGLLLIALVGVVFCLVYFVAPRTHRIYYDEDIYANVGQTIASQDLAGYCNYGTFEYGEYQPHWTAYNKEPSGWPYLISLIFRLMGTEEAHAFLLNNLFFCGSVLIAFSITRLIAGGFLPALIAGLCLALIPQNILWSNTAAAEPSAVFWTGLTVWALCLFLKSGRSRHLLFLSLFLPFACQMRLESLLIVFWCLGTLLLFRPGLLKEQRLWWAGLLTTFFLLPHFLHFYAVSGHSWGAEGSRFALGFFAENIGSNGLFYLNNEQFPVLITVLALIGLFASRQLVKWRVALAVWFLLFWGVFLFFYAGSYDYGADVRFALLSFVPLSILAGMGSGRIMAWLAARPCIGLSLKPRLIAGLIVLVLVFSFTDFLPLVRRVGQEAWGSRYDHLHARHFRQQMPRRSIILTQNPAMFLLWEQAAIQTYAGLNDPGLIKDLLGKYQGEVYFHYNYWCNTRTERNRRLCRGIMETYTLQEVASAAEQDYEYRLFRILGFQEEPD